MPYRLIRSLNKRAHLARRPLLPCSPEPLRGDMPLFGSLRAIAGAALFLVAGAASAHAQTAPDSSGVQPVATNGPVSTPPSDSPEHAGSAPQAVATRLTGSVTVDGRLDEPIWLSAPAITEMRQRRPVEGVAASLRTDIRIVYDDEAIYIGARMFDDQPERIVGRLARRDADTGSDLILIQFDPYHNHNGDASFSLNPKGQRWDGGNGDESWDPVWQGKATVDSLGWTAEMRIPFSQLRFRPGATGPWGLQIERYINRLNETDVWSYWQLNESGGPSRWGHLSGITNPSKLPGRLELLPYAVTMAKLNDRADALDPFANKREGTLRVGADIKYQVTPTLTLSATINPDFGQAEVDPAVVNLSAFETFFNEKREFFIEGRDKFQFGSLWCFTCSNTSSLSMLFTRRIGRSPQASGLAFDRGEHADVPEATTILGAAKLTGRTSAGWNIGILNAVTAREQADVRAGTTNLRQEVEPATNYFVSRVSRDLQNGNLRVGAIATSVLRGFDDPALADRLNRHSEGFGLDTEYWWANRSYHLIAQAAFTNISGEPAAILRAQTSSARYFQRPDREHGSNGLFTDRFDPTLTSMRGYGGYVRLARESGDFRWESSLNVRSPGFENNDIAALSRVDYIWMHGNINRRWTKPGKYYRSAGITFGGQQQYNYDGDINARQIHAVGWIEAPFYWEVGSWSSYRPSVLDERRTRGGPVVALASEKNVEAWLYSDRRKQVYFNLSPWLYTTGEGGRNRGLNVGLTWQPASNVAITLGPSYSAADSKAQYVTAVDDATAQLFYGKRYVFADVDQRTVSMDTRLNVTFTPAMSLQLFAQPFISSNDFSAWKEYARPRVVDKLVYGRDIGTVSERLDAGGRTIVIDPDADGPANPFEFRDRDFTLRSLRGNAVFRWEYVPGSTLFVVWTQDRASEEATGDFDFGRDRRALFSSPARHVLLMKVNYWLPL